MKPKYVIILLIATFFFSCSNDDFNEEKVTPSLAEINNLATSGLDVALEKTKSSWSVINMNNAMTRSSHGLNDMKVINYQKRTFKIQNAENFNTMTRSSASSNNDTQNLDTVSVYLVDFEQNGSKGFSIASDDYRLPYAIAITENGSLADTIFNEGLAIYINDLDEVCKYQLAKYAEQETSSATNTKASGYYSKFKPEILKKLVIDSLPMIGWMILYQMLMMVM